MGVVDGDDLGRFLLRKIQDEWAELSAQGCVVESIHLDKVLWSRIKAVRAGWMAEMSICCDIEVIRDEMMDGATLYFREKDGSEGHSRIYFGRDLFRVKT